MALPVVLGGNQRPWHIWSFVDMGNRHVLIRQEFFSMLPNMDSFMIIARQAVLELLATENFFVISDIDVHINGDDMSLCCQLLDYAEAIQITEHLTPADLYFLSDISRPVLRVDYRAPPRECADEGIYLPYSRHLTTSIYWRIILQVVHVPLPITTDPLITFPITLVSGTRSYLHTTMTIRMSCVYEEFLGALPPVFDQLDRHPWKNQKTMLDHGKQFHTSALRFFLCPEVFSEDDFHVLSAIQAGLCSKVEYMLHELVWSDWFKEVPISRIPDQATQYGILITPGDNTHWSAFNSDNRFVRTLEDA
jgi:hypothetical protein